MRTCLICDSILFKKKIYNQHNENIPLYFLKRILRRNRSTNDTFEGVINICANCGHGVMETPPTPHALEEYYKKKYWSSRSPLTEEAISRIDAYKYDIRAQHQVDFVLGHLREKMISEILEIGAGSAFASLVLREKYDSSLLKLNVCEPGENWLDYYKKNGITNVSSYFPFETEKKFDYIHTSHWLEHVLDLQGTVSRLRQILEPDGYIFVEVPNTEHYYWDLPLEDTPHIQFFTKSSLIQIFKKHGFECDRIGTFGQTFYEKYQRVPLTAGHHVASDNGFWIRSLFRKNSLQN